MRIAVILAILVAGSNLFAQNGPENVIELLLEKYPRSKDHECVKLTAGYECSFEYKGEISVAYFDSKTSWIETRTVIDHTTLHQAIVEALEHEFTDPAINSAERVDSKVGRLFEVIITEEAIEFMVVLDSSGDIKRYDRLDTENDATDFDHPFMDEIEDDEFPWRL